VPMHFMTVPLTTRFFASAVQPEKFLDCGIVLLLCYESYDGH
jgi:hypothetical protein